MPIRQRVLGAVLSVMVCTPGFALAQGGGDHWRLHPPTQTSPSRGSTMQMEGMLQQMGGMLEHMAARLQAGPMTPEQTTQMGEVMGHIAEMLNTSYGMKGAETPQQILTMMEQMTAMHKRLMRVMALSQATPARK